jgi:hypothetical protein
VPRLFGYPNENLNVGLVGVASPQTPEWVLAIVGTITFVVIGWQAYETRRAADATGIAATASRDSADALIASERAWVVAELIPTAFKFTDQKWYRAVGTMHTMLSAEETIRGEHLHHKLKLTNMGRTPATIIGFKSHIRVCQKRSKNYQKEKVNKRLSIRLNTFSQLEILSKSMNPLWMCGII